MHGRKYKEGERYRPIVTIDKVKGRVPTVIMVSGRRYVYDPNTQNRRGGK